MAIQRKASARPKKPERGGLGSGLGSAPPRKRRSNVFVTIGPGNMVVARAVDTVNLFKDGYVHMVTMQRKDNSTYTFPVLCLDPKDEGEPCPGCRDDVEQRYRFWMVVIQRDAPKENKSGKVIGEEDQVLILSGGRRLYKALNAKQKRRDLTKRDVEIAQDDEGTEVSYEVEWADEEDSKLSRADERLLEDANDVLDAFDRYTVIRDEDSFYDAPSFNGSDEDDDEDVGERSRRRGSVFDKERKKGAKRRTVKDDNDEDDDEAPRRRIKSSKKTSAAKRKPGVNINQVRIKPVRKK